MPVQRTTRSLPRHCPLPIPHSSVQVLSAIYNQLGNAYFYVGKFHKALEYHKKDLEIAEKLNDRQARAIASPSH